MASVNNINPKVDLTVRVFDNFYNYQQEVNANEFDAVNTFFLSIYQSPETALNFTTTLFRISAETQIPVLTLLEQIQGQNEVELTATMAYYMNGIRSLTTLLGINARVTPNYYTARNVLP